MSETINDRGANDLVRNRIETSFLKSSAITFIAKVLSMFLNLGWGIIVARLFGRQGKGSLALFTTTTTYLLMFSKLGMGQAGIHHIGSGKYPKQKVAGTIISAGAIIGLLSAGLTAAYAYAFNAHLLGEETAMWTVWLLLLATPAMVINLLARSIYLANGRIAFYNLISLIIHPLTLSIVLFRLLSTGQLEVEELLVASASSLVIVAIANMAIMRLTGLMHFAFCRDLFGSLVKYGIRSTIGNVSQGLILPLDYFIIEALWDTETVGVYSVAVGLIEKLLFVPRSMSPILFQRVSSMTEQDSTRFTVELYKKVLVLLIPSSLALVLLARPFIYILYPGFEAALEATYILLPGLVMLSLFEIISSSLLGQGKTSAYMSVSLLAAAVNAGLCFALTPLWGINGTAAASTIAYILLSSSALYLFAKSSNVPVSSLVKISKKDCRDLVEWVWTPLKKRFWARNKTGLDS